MRILLLLILNIYLNPSYAQLTAVDRHTGRIIPCKELGCYEEDANYESTDRICLNCFYRVSDSTMNSIKEEIQKKIKKSTKKYLSFNKSQRIWEEKRDNAAIKVSDEYKGGTMEMTEFVRIRLIFNKKRINYLKNYLEKLSD